MNNPDFEISKESCKECDTLVDVFHIKETRNGLKPYHICAVCIKCTLIFEGVIEADR